MKEVQPTSKRVIFWREDTKFEKEGGGVLNLLQLTVLPNINITLFKIKTNIKVILILVKIHLG